MPDKRGLTPGGYRDPDAIQRVASGQRLHRTADGYEIRDKAAGRVVRAFRSRPPTTTRFAPKALKPAPGATADGWQVYVDWINDTGNPISLMQTTWIVPPPPADVSDQTIFLFPGIENIAGDIGILQPVLQWGVSHIGGGPYWAVSSWYVPTTGEAFYSNELVKVPPGQSLTGTMRLVPVAPGDTAPPAGTYHYDCEFTGISGTDLATRDLPELTWANLTLEAYAVGNRNQYPAAAATTYASLNLAAGPGLVRIPWSRVIRTGAYGENVNAVSDAVPGGCIEITY